ncbi:MAG: Ig-like domain-containing protein, partial [Sediminispirochaetaceae bacterium]
MKNINIWKKRSLALTGAAVLAILVMLSGCPANPFYGLEPKPRDSEGPDVTIINPEEDQVLSGLLVITGIATDKYQIDSVSIIVDGGSPVKLDGTNNWYYLLDTTKISEGEHTVTILAKDQFGNTSQSPVTFTVDQTVPNINVDLDPGIDDTAVWLSGTNAVITGTATDEYAVDRVEISFDGVTFYQADYDSETDTWSYTVADTAGILPGDGTTIAYLRVTDSAGLPGSTNFPLYIVNAAPAFTFTYPVDDQNIDSSEDLSGNILDVTIEADDGVSAFEALDHIDVTLDTTEADPAVHIESLANEAAAGSNVIEIDVSSITDSGPVDLTVTAVNKSGTETVKTIAIAFDDNPPVMGDTVAADGKLMDDDLTNPDINFSDGIVKFEGTVTTASVASAQVKMVDTSTQTDIFGYTDMSGGVVGSDWSHDVDFGAYDDGEYDLVFKITEAIGDGGGFDTVTRSFRHDATDPVVTVDEPTDADPGDGIEVGVGTVPIGGEITNASSGSPVQSISITVAEEGGATVDYGPFTAPNWTGISYSSGQFSYLWDNTAFTPGQNLNITATVSDLAGNEGESPIHTVQVAPGAPNASFDEHTNPDSGLIITIGADPYIHGGATIKGQATDSDGSIAAVRVKIDAAVDFTDLILSGPSPLTWNYTLGSLSEG